MTHRVRAAVLVLCLVAAGCHEEGIRVADLDIRGAQAFSGKAIRQLIQTREAGPWPWVHWRPFDKDVFERDLERIRAFYHDRGYDQALVRASRVEFNGDGDTVRLTVTIEEGTPVTLTGVSYRGLEEIPEALADRVRSLAPADNTPRSVAALSRVRDGALAAFRDNGYPYASVELEETGGPQPRTIAVIVHVAPGAVTRFGSLQINGLERTKSVVIRRALSFKPGDLYRESDILTSQRRLRQFAAFEFAHLGPDEEARATQVPELPMVATIAEAKPHRFEVGVGYGTEERFRGSFEWRNVNFYGNASQWVGNARYSTIRRGAGFGYDHPYLLRSGGTLTARSGAWWVTESAFTSRTLGGQLAFSHAFGRRDTGTARVQYRYEWLRYQVTNPLLKFEERIALGLDPDTGRGDGAVAGVELRVQESRVDNPTDPTRGVTAAVTAEHVASWVGSSFRYDKLSAEARGYVPLTSRLTLAARAGFGTLSSKDATSVPFAERFFLGGASSMRGWGRFEVGPISEDGSPIGGRSILDTSVELRAEVCCGIGVVTFADMGQVWADDWTLRLPELKKAIGAGVRYQTIVGVVRADVGYQLSPIRGLRIDGESQSRRWRLHLTIGHAF